MSAILFLAAAPVSADEYSRMAGELSKAAVKQGRKRVAVIPFQSVGARGGEAGLVVSEKLIAPILASALIEVVERTMLQSVLKEQRLELSGATDSRSIKELGKILGVDAIVTGTVLELKGDRVEVNARLIDSETARVLSVAVGKVEKDWAEPLFGSPFNVPVPSLDSFEITKDAIADDDSDCRRAGRRAADIERDSVDIKARYWAARLRSPGFTRASLKTNPGSEIEDAGVKADFYMKLRRYYEESPAPVSDSDLQRLTDGQAKIQRIHELCHTGGA